jgi:hypothetical protein
MSSDPTNTTPVTSDPAADKAFIDSVIALKDPIQAAWNAGVKAGVVKWSRTQWLTLGGAVLVAVLATFGVTTSTIKPSDPTPSPVPVAPAVDVGKVIADGFASQSKQLQENTQAIIKAIEFKPFVPPIDPNPVAKGAIPSEVTAKVGRLVTIKSSEAVDQWVVPPGSPCECDFEGKKLTLVPTEAVEFSVGVVTQKGKVLTWCLVKAGLGPKPPPKPDDPPKPIDPPAPIPVAGLRVLIVEESAQRHTLSQGQRTIILGKEFRDLLESKCVMGPDGRTKEYRIYDQEIAMNGESKLWQDVMKRPRASVPWIVISNGKTGFEGPLPTNLPDAIALINKYAGVNP